LSYTRIKTKAFYRHALQMLCYKILIIIQLS